MTNGKTSETMADGYWTIQVATPGATGGRYVCRALDDAHARTIALHLLGSPRNTPGYDCHRIDNPRGRHARALKIGQSETIDSFDTWAALLAARRPD